MSGRSAKIKAAFAFARKKKMPADAASADEIIDHQLVANLSEKKLPSFKQLKQLGKILNPSEKKRFLVVLLIFILAFVGLVISWYFQNTTAIPTYGGSYVEGLVGTPRFINPLLAPNADADRDISQLIFSGLVKQTPDGQIKPDLANSFSISEDGKTYIFNLRDNVYWHDDELLTAEDVVYTIAAIQDEEFQSPLRPSFSGIRVSALDQFTVKFELEKAYAPFLSSLTVGIIPRHIWYPIPSNTASLSEYMIKPVGTGPYRFKDFTKDSKTGGIRLYTLEANTNYYERAPYIAEISFKFYPDFISGVEALRNQNIDSLSLLPKEYLETERSNKKINILNLSLPQYTAIFFNPGQNAVLADVKIRQALAYATNRTTILEQALDNEGDIINSPILPGSPGYVADLPSYDFNPDKAKELLNQAGWTLPEGATYRKNKDDQELTVRLTTVDQPENTTVLSIIKDNWESIGIKTELDIVSKNNIKKDIIEPRNYQMLLFGQIVGQTNDPYPFWHSSQVDNPGLNLSKLANKDIDSSLEAARNADNQEELIAAYKAFQTKLQENAFAIFLYNPSYTYPISKKIKGLESLISINIPAERFLDVTNWYIKTKRTWSRG